MITSLGIACLSHCEVFSTITFKTLLNGNLQNAKKLTLQKYNYATFISNTWLLYNSLHFLNKYMLYNTLEVLVFYQRNYSKIISLK